MFEWWKGQIKNRAEEMRAILTVLNRAHWPPPVMGSTQYKLTEVHRPVTNSDVPDDKIELGMMVASGLHTPSKDAKFTLRLVLKYEMPGTKSQTMRTKDIPVDVKSDTKVAQKLMLTCKKSRSLSSVLQRRGVEMEVWQVNRGMSLFYPDRIIAIAFVPFETIVSESTWEGQIPLFAPGDDAQKLMKKHSRPAGGDLASAFGIPSDDAASGMAGGTHSSSAKAPDDGGKGPMGTIRCRLRISQAPVAKIKKKVVTHVLPKIAAWPPAEVPSALQAAAVPHASSGSVSSAATGIHTPQEMSSGSMPAKPVAASGAGGVASSSSPAVQSDEVFDLEVDPAMLKNPRSAMYVYNYTVLQQEQERLQPLAEKNQQARVLLMLVERRLEDMFAAKEAGNLTPVVYAKGLMKGIR